MEQTFKVAVLIGSLRKESYSRKIAKALIALAPKNISLEIVEIGGLPYYNEDLDTAQPPASWVSLREKIKAADGYLFVTPEYNRSVPAVLKNALDVASRPYGQNAFAGKSALVVSQSIGALAGFGANHHLRQSLVFLDVLTVQQPEAYIGQSATVINEEGKPANDGLYKYMESIMNSFAVLLRKNA